MGYLPPYEVDRNDWMKASSFPGFFACLAVALCLPQPQHLGRYIATCGGALQPE